MATIRHYTQLGTAFFSKELTEDKTYLRSLQLSGSFKGFLVLHVANIMLRENELTPYREIALELSLSSIINIVNPEAQEEMVGIDIGLLCTEEDYEGMKPSAIRAFQEIIKIENVYEMAATIQTRKSELSRTRTTETE